MLLMLLAPTSEAWFNTCENDDDEEFKNVDSGFEPTLEPPDDAFDAAVAAAIAASTVLDRGRFMPLNELLLLKLLPLTLILPLLQMVVIVRVTSL